MKQESLPAFVHGGKLVRSGTVFTPWLSVAEGAAYLGMGETVFKKLVDTGAITSTMRGKSHRMVHVADLDEYQRSCPSGSKALPALQAV